jgi:electron transfer flavoprotein alpha/beta subunit
MKAVEFEALEGAEPLAGAKALAAVNRDELKREDRVLIFTRSSADYDAVELGLRLREKGIPFVAVSTVAGSTDSADLAEMADVHIDLLMTKGLLPDDLGNRFGFPTSMAGLFVYYGLKFTIEEIIAEYEE